MKITEYIEHLAREGRLMAAAAEQAGPDAPVPTCPGWRIRDLLRHTGTVHRWAAGFVAEGHTGPRAEAPEPDLDGAELLEWFREGHAALVDALRTAEPDLECWTFLPAPSPLAFWARRQAHETAVHRIDAESARDGHPGPTGAGHAADLAVDGVDELLRGFHARPRSRVRTAEPRVLRVRATDPGTGAIWTVRLSQEPPVTVPSDDGSPADCEISGPAAHLYAALWNRAPAPVSTGDPGLARLWRETSAVTWK